MKKLNVISIDGIRGIGKTTQLSMIRNLLKTNEIDYKVFDINQEINVEYIRNRLKDLEEYLVNNPDSVALCDGSIATNIIEEHVKNTTQLDTRDKYKDVIQMYESMNCNYNFVNILMTSDKVDFCNERLEKKFNFNNLKNKNKDLFLKIDIDYLKQVSKGLGTFNDNIININMDFHVVTIGSADSMLQVHDRIIQTITNEFQIESPSKKGAVD